jgi:hypothetical protein
MTRNVGTLDRILRVALGLALILGFVLNDTASPWRWLYLLGVIPLATGLMGRCGVYSLLGISTCPTRR